jgi:hypothetical protein
LQSILEFPPFPPIPSSNLHGLLDLLAFGWICRRAGWVLHQNLARRAAGLERQDGRCNVARFPKPARCLTLLRSKKEPGSNLATMAMPTGSAFMAH